MAELTLSRDPATGKHAPAACHNCKFRHADQCRKAEPRLVRAMLGDRGEYATQAIWPQVNADSWCGSHTWRTDLGKGGRS